jgi:hypothetical protein
MRWSSTGPPSECYVSTHLLEDLDVAMYEGSPMYEGSFIDVPFCDAFGLPHALVGSLLALGVSKVEHLDDIYDAPEVIAQIKLEHKPMEFIQVRTEITAIRVAFTDRSSHLQCYYHGDPTSGVSTAGGGAAAVKPVFKFRNFDHLLVDGSRASHIL